MPTRRTANPGRRAKPPASGNLPAHGKRILTAAYESAKARALEQGKSATAAKRTASAQAWCAVKRSYYKRGAKWVKRKATLGTGEQPPGCTPLRRRKNPAGWTRGKTSTDRHGNEQIEYTRGDRKAKLTLHDESVTATVEGHHLEEAPDQSKFYRSEQAALADASRVADLFDDRRVKRFPTRGEDWEPYLEWFKMQSPNQADYVTLFWTNDPNGAYDSLLLEPISESEATFDETFVDEGYRKGEHDENPEPDDEEDDEPNYEDLRQRYRGDVEYENPYLGDAVELSQRRKYEEERSRWEKGGRHGPPPAPPRSQRRNPPKRKRRPGPHYVYMEFDTPSNFRAFGLLASRYFDLGPDASKELGRPDPDTKATEGWWLPSSPEASVGFLEVLRDYGGRVISSRPVPTTNPQKNPSRIASMSRRITGA